MSTTMSTVIFIPASSLLQSSSSSSSSSSRKISSLCSFSNSASSIPKNAIFQNIKCVPLLGLTPFSQWSGLKNMGVSISCPVKMERKGKCKGKGVYASLFGVGAPEVLVIGVVALLVFGPKGLAEVARNLGKTLRAFQPTIRELQEVSREFKSTLEREIGLDDIDTPVQKRSNTTESTPEPNGSSAETAEDPADSALKMKADKFRGALAQLQKEQEEERLQKEEEEKQKEEEQRQKEEAQSQGQVVESEATSQETSEALDTPQAEDTVEETSSVTPPTENSNSNALQEVGAGAPNGSASNTETQS